MSDAEVYEQFPRLDERRKQRAGTLKQSTELLMLDEQNAVAAVKIADRWYVIDQGEIVIEGPAEELRADDENPTAVSGSVTWHG